MAFNYGARIVHFNCSFVYHEFTIMSADELIVCREHDEYYDPELGCPGCYGAIQHDPMDWVEE